MASCKSRAQPFSGICEHGPNHCWEIKLFDLCQNDVNMAICESKTIPLKPDVAIARRNYRRLAMSSLYLGFPMLQRRPPRSEVKDIACC
jgi:hypothetical protein